MFLHVKFVETPLSNFAIIALLPLVWSSGSPVLRTLPCLASSIALHVPSTLATVISGIPPEGESADFEPVRVFPFAITQVEVAAVSLQFALVDAAVTAIFSSCRYCFSSYWLLPCWWVPWVARLGAIVDFSTAC